MIPFDFEYYQPATKEEALALFAELSSQEKQPLYYAGGTEIISFARLNSIFTKAVIDIKAIPECSVLEFQQDQVIVGAAVTLTAIQEANLFPLLSEAAGRVADHTTRGKITLGGNLLSRLPYREAILPLLAAESEIVTLGRSGLRKRKLTEIYQETLKLEPGELLLQVATAQAYTRAPYLSLKKTSQGDVAYPQNKIGYPVVSLAALSKDEQLSLAISGLCAYPLRSEKVERALSSCGTAADRINFALSQLPAPVVDDLEASSPYRQFVFKEMLSQVLASLRG